MRISGAAWWFRVHRNVAVLTVAVGLGAVACALAYQRGRLGTVRPVSRHGKLGVAAVALLCAQPVNALVRPRVDPLRRWRTLRFAWLVLHRSGAAAAMGVGVAALFSGEKEETHTAAPTILLRDRSPGRSKPCDPH